MGSGCFSINCFIRKYCFIKTNQLNDFVNEQYHLYFIVSEPKSYFVDNSIKIGNQTFKCSIVKNNIHIEIDMVIIPEFLDGIITSISFKLSNDKSTMVLSYYKNFRHEKDILLTANDIYKRSRHCDLVYCEVLYIGQALGRKTKRVAATRLINHSTLGKIQSDLLNNGSNDELTILLCDFSLDAMLSLTPDDKLKDKAEKFYDFWNNRSKFSHKLVIDTAEAGLINYFKPVYNTVYIDKIYRNANNSKFKELYQYHVDKIQIQFVPDQEEFTHFGNLTTYKPDICLFTKTARYNTKEINKIIECNLNDEGTVHTDLVEY